MSEGKELAHIDEVRAVAERTGVAGVVGFIMEAATSGAVDAGVLTAMTQLATSMKAEERLDADRRQLAEFNRDFNAAIMAMPVITKAGIIKIPANAAKGTPERTQGRFARFEDIDRVVRPILRDHNLAIRFDVGESDKVTTVTPIMMHSNGHTERGGTMRLPLDDSGAKNNVQGVGSSVSYGKRYTMCAMLNIITEGTDDDGSLGKFEIGMPHEREVTVLEQAEGAHGAGTYDTFFNAQSPKDRAWLISSGHHARLGGAPALPDISRSSGTAPGSGDQGASAGHDINTAGGWTAQYEDDCAAAPDLETLQRVQAKGKRALDRLREGDKQLYDRAVKAGSDAFARLSGGDL